MYRVNMSRIEAVARALKEIGVERILVLETRDPQYIALKDLARERDCRTAFLVAVANALISYRLTGYGEDYWTEVSQFFRKHNGSLEELFIEFLQKHSRYNRLSIAAKIRRLRKFFSSKLYNTLLEQPSKYCNDLYSLVKQLSTIYRQPVNAKTIVFAAKMYSYVCRICHGKPVIDHRIEIPVDKRITTFTLTSGIVEPTEEQLTRENLRKHVETLMTKHRKLVLETWRKISKETSIPPLQLDTIIWLTTRYINIENQIEAIKKIIEKYGDIIPLKQLEQLYKESVYTINQR
ncbi:N-glycosylase/DNA lyase [Desulfurococcaceae archaeon MEX13E-LK6-19]|nr:N-glycosylase/DNA lyase [Desulfurococcaceae archaeon MEX13E-LK6-19]